MIPFLHEIDWQLLGLWLLMSLATAMIWGCLSWAVVNRLRQRDRRRTRNDQHGCTP
jgi:hypothetical protein